MATERRPPIRTPAQSSQPTSEVRAQPRSRFEARVRALHSAHVMLTDSELLASKHSERTEGPVAAVREGSAHLQRGSKRRQRRRATLAAAL
jgi:hypothetical protein